MLVGGFGFRFHSVATRSTLQLGRCLRVQVRSKLKLSNTHMDTSAVGLGASNRAHLNTFEFFDRALVVAGTFFFTPSPVSV